MFDYTLEPGKELIERKYKQHAPVISIITPFYSGAEYIEQTAKSVLNQTFPYFEWIIVDDGSKYGNKEELLKKIEQLDERITVFSKKNEGLAATRDFGAKISSKSCKYLLFLDDDDLLDKTFLETSYYSMETNSKASWCYADVVDFQKDKLQWKMHYDPKIMLTNNLITATALIKKEDFWLVNGYELREKNVNEDWNFWLKLIEKEKFPIHMSYNGFWYRIKENGELTKAKDNQERNFQIIDQTRKKIKKLVPAIEYPRDLNIWENIPDNKVLIPQYKKDSKKNILLIIPFMVVGGADKFNIDLIRLVDKEKFKFTIVTTQPTQYVWRQKFEQYADSVFELPSFIDSKYWPAFVEYLMVSRNIDIVFISNSITGYEMSPLLKAKFPNIPIMDYIHMEEWYNRNGGYSRDSSAFSEIIDRTLLCNKSSEKILVDYFKRNPKDLNTVYIGVDEKKFDPQKYDKKYLMTKYGLPKDKKIISYVARIDYQKRPFLLLEIVKKISEKRNDLLFVVAGDGPLLEDLKYKAKEKKINKYFKFLGQVNKPEEIFVVSDLSLNCSIKEGLALTSYESLSLGIPVVSSDVGGQKELISNEVGAIVPCLQKEQDVTILKYTEEEVMNYVNAINNVLQKSKYFKDNCRKRILNGFTLDNMATNMQKEFNYVLKNNKEKNIIRGKELSNNIKIIKEYIMQYYLGEFEEYKYLCSIYNKNVYGYIPQKNVEEIDNNEQKIIKNLNFTKVFNSIYRLAIKLHIYNEVYLLINLILSIYYGLKKILIGVFSFIYHLILLESKRICKLFVKIFKK